ncbi:MAG: hypothetical protein ACTHVY_10900, partial [Brevibacterium yomogidense]
RKLPGGTTARTSVPWYDIALALLIMITAIYYGMNGQRIFERGWDYVAPPTATVFAFILWALVLETLRRTAGLIVTGIALVFSLYPIFAAGVPVSFLQGIPFRMDLTTRWASTPSSACPCRRRPRSSWASSCSAWPCSSPVERSSSTTSR